jgi:RHS repeat-associated protein
MAHRPAAGLGGNVIAWTSNYTYAADRNRLLSTSSPNPSDPPARYAHDAHGNVTSMPHLSRMLWNDKEELTEVDLDGGGVARYRYDASGQRVRKVVQKQSVSEERIYLGDFEVYRRRRGDELEVERETLHVMDDQDRVALIETQTAGTVGVVGVTRERYQVSNHLGSSALEVNGDGAIISFEDYHPYGTAAFRWVSGEVSAKRYRYTGKERDEETGFTYHGARYYAPWLGRWTSPDPAGFVDGTNPFVYARNAPTVLSDPNGLNARSTEIDEARQMGRSDTTLELTSGRIASFLNQRGPGGRPMLPGELSDVAQSPAGNPEGALQASQILGLVNQGLVTYSEGRWSGVRAPTRVWDADKPDLLRAYREGQGEAQAEATGFALARVEELALASAAPRALPWLSSGALGELGERIGRAFLRGLGFPELEPLQNRSNQGLDGISARQTRGGSWQIVVVDVKSTQGDQVRLARGTGASSDQLDVQTYLQGRLDAARRDEATRPRAERLLRILSLSDTRVRGYVVGIRQPQSVTGPEVSLFQWTRSGVGARLGTWQLETGRLLAPRAGRNPTRGVRVAPTRGAK